MINIKRLIINAEKMYPLLEDSFPSLKSSSDAARKSRASSITVFYQGLDQAPDGHARTNWKVPSQSSRKNVGKKGNDYLVVVEIKVNLNGGLFTIAKEKWNMKRFAEVFATSDVRVHCTCPDFYYGGAKYNLGPSGGHKGNLALNKNSGYAGEPTSVGNNLAPDVRDPERKHVLCKHLIAVATWFPGNASKIMSDAKKYNIEIEVTDKATKDAEDGTPELEKDKNLVEVSDELKKAIIDPLISAAEELDKNQENLGAEDIVDEENISTEHEIEDVPAEETEEVIEDENIEAEEVEPEDETEDIISDRNETVIEKEDETGDIIEDENIERDEKKKLEKDKDSEDSKVSDDPEELLGR